MNDFAALSPEGRTLRWEHEHGEHSEALTLTWENEAWTASGHVAGAGVQYVLRLSPVWAVRQFLLFRDRDEPDLWLATDADHRWGEMNGVYRRELDGCADIHLDVSAFTAGLPLRRLDVSGVDPGRSVAAKVIEIDVETLAVTPVATSFTRLDDGRWERAAPARSDVVGLDEHGLVTDVAGRFRRTPEPAA